MTTQTSETDFKEILDAHRIDSTPRRLAILKAILSNPSKEFTIAEIDAVLKKDNPVAGTSSVINTLLLFRNTGLIRETSDIRRPKPQKGRPKSKFILVDLPSN